MDIISTTERSKLMRKIKGKDTGLEILVRKLAYSMGYRYRLHRKDIPGTPDLAFIGRRKVIFVNGCFWHQHRDCPRANRPKTNVDYWNAKLDANIKRDSANYQQLKANGWSVLIIWECETNDLSQLKRKITTFLSD